MKIVLDDIWVDGVHYDHVEFEKELADDCTEQDITDAIIEFFNGKA